MSGDTLQTIDNVWILHWTEYEVRFIFSLEIDVLSIKSDSQFDLNLYKSFSLNLNIQNLCEF